MSRRIFVIKDVETNVCNKGCPLYGGFFISILYKHVMMIFVNRNSGNWITSFF